MSTSQVLDTGYYYIVNDQWRNHVGVCDWDQHGNHVIKAEVQDISDNAKWYVQQLRNKNYTFHNVGRRLYAVVQSGSQEQAPVQGRLHHQHQQWKLTEQREPGKYTIEKTDTWLVWNLPDGEIKTTVELAKNTHDRRAWWRFVSASDYMVDNPDHPPAGNSTQGDDPRTSPPPPPPPPPPTSRPTATYLDLSAPDLIKTLESIVGTKRKLTRSHADNLSGLLSTPAGRQSIVDVSNAPDTILRVLDYLNLARPAEVLEDKDSWYHVTAAFGAALLVFPKGSVRRPNSKLRPLLANVSKEDCDKILNVFGYGPFLTLSGHTNYVTSVTYSPNGKFIASGSSDHAIRLWDAETGQPVGEPLRVHESSVFSVAFSPDGQRLASGVADKTVRVWSLETQPAVATTLTGHTRTVFSVAFSPDGRSIVSGSYDNTVRIWDIETGLTVGQPLRGHTDFVKSVVFSPDGTQIVSTSDDCTIRIWNATTHKIIKVLEGHTNWVTSVVFQFSPDGPRLISGSRDNTIRTWDPRTGKMVLPGPLRGHTNSISSVAISSNGKYIASGSYDDTVRLWDAATGRAVGEPLRGHRSDITSVAFSPDSRRVVSGSDDKTLMIWEVE